LSSAQKGILDEKFKWKAREMDKRREGRPGEGRSDMRVIDARSDESRSSLRRSAMDTGYVFKIVSSRLAVFAYSRANH
jgi:hypothetical protein